MVKSAISEQRVAPPEVLAYVSGAHTPEHFQFEFLIGCWDVEATKMSAEGHRLSYSATWEAKYLNDKRMVMDDFRALGPRGEAVSSYITLRTYSPITGRWEHVGLGAQAAAVPILEWHGALEGKDMHLRAVGLGPEGNRVHNKIRFYDIEEKQFKWESSMSFDNESTWVNVGALVAKKRNNTCR